MKIATVGGIGVFIHWTFWVLMVFYLLPVLTQEGIASALSAAAFIAGVFGSVVAHEFGHAMAARHYGIPTLDITLLPIGGVARLARLPEKPMQELVIALAGPAVNVVLALGLFILFSLGVQVGHFAPALGNQMDLVAQLIAANVVLCVFNLLPAFPMDGGRVLRGLLAMRLGHLRATEIAARVGRWMALCFAVLSFFSSITLLLLAGFIYLAGTAELIQARLKATGSPSGFPGGSHPLGGASQGAGWQSRVWPDSGAFRKDPFGHAAGREDTERDGTIDAVDVRRINTD